MNKTVIIASHNIDLLEKLCDKFIWLDNGKIEKYANIKEIKRLYLIEMLQDTREIDILPKDKYELEFDVFQRYEPVRIILEKYFRDSNIVCFEPFPLETQIVFKYFFNKFNVTIVGNKKLKINNYIKSEFCNTMFKDNYFDIFFSLDHLSTIDGSKFEETIDEIFRITKKVIIIGNPTDEHIVKDAEYLLYQFQLKRFNFKNSRLKIYLDSRLPFEQMLTNYLKNLNCDFIILNNGYIYNWLNMMLINSYFRKFYKFSRIYRELNRVYNLNFFKSDNIPPCYRKIFIISKNSNINLKEIKDLFNIGEKDNLKGTDLFSFLVRDLEKNGIKPYLEEEKEIIKNSATISSEILNIMKGLK